MFIQIIAKFGRKLPETGRKLPKTGRKLPKLRLICGKNIPPALLFVAGMREKLYLCRFDSKKTKNGHGRMKSFR